MNLADFEAALEEVERNCKGLSMEISSQDGEVGNNTENNERAEVQKNDHAKKTASLLAELESVKGESAQWKKHSVRAFVLEKEDLYLSKRTLAEIENLRETLIVLHDKVQDSETVAEIRKSKYFYC